MIANTAMQMGLARHMVLTAMVASPAVNVARPNNWWMGAMARLLRIATFGNKYTYSPTKYCGIMILSAAQ